jgi:hypothetical protein
MTPGEPPLFVREEVTRLAAELGRPGMELLELVGSAEREVDPVFEGEERWNIALHAVRPVHASPAARLREMGASQLGETYSFDSEILSFEGPLTLPSSISAECRKCDASEAAIGVDPQELAMLPDAMRRNRLREIADDALHHGASCKAPIVSYSEAQRVDYARLTIGDDPDQTAMAEERDDARFELHLVGPKPPLGGKARIEAAVQTNEFTRRLELVSHSFDEIEGRPTSPDLTPEKRLALASIGMLPMEKLRRQVAPDMVGRPIVQEGRLLTLCSIGRIPDINGKEIRGTLTEALDGDTTTNKSESAKDSSDQGFGPVLQAENASRTGLLYSITESNSGGWRLTWGQLPRQHGRWCVIDGLEAWHSERQGELRAAMRDQAVSVDRVVRGKRPVRVRLTITANPNKSMREYPFKCMAIPDTRPFARGPDMARVDLWYLFAKDDVSSKDISNRSLVERPVAYEDFRDLVWWAWSRRPGDVSYAVAAKELIRTESSRMMDEYGSALIPIVSDGFRDTLCRVSAAEAALHFSTIDGEALVVGEEHARAAVDFLRRMYDAIDLRAFREHNEEGRVVDGGSCLQLAVRVGRRGILILGKLASHADPVSANALASELGDTWTGNIVRDEWKSLEGEGLVLVKHGVGASLSVKGTALFSWLRRVQEGGD